MLIIGSGSEKLWRFIMNRAEVMECLDIPEDFSSFDIHRYLVPLDALPPVTVYEGKLRRAVDMYINSQWVRNVVG